MARPIRQFASSRILATGKGGIGGLGGGRNVLCWNASLALKLSGTITMGISVKMVLWLEFFMVFLVSKNLENEDAFEEWHLVYPNARKMFENVLKNECGIRKSFGYRKINRLIIERKDFVYKKKLLRIDGLFMLLQLISRKKIIAKENERIHYSITKRDRSCNKV